LRSPPPHVIGVGGAVAVGKSTVADQLASQLRDTGRQVDVVATDAFLLSNIVLNERNLTLRKGFPESFDVEALLAFVADVRRGTDSVEIPVYSHAIYDIVPGETTVLESPDLVLLEGVVALQPPVVDVLDASIYVDAEESDIREWFVTRFLAMTAAATDDEGSFYRMFSALPRDDVQRIAEGTWDGINGVNLREHILPSRARAAFVVEKAKDHSITGVIEV
jgi:type I pantothenate kinase